MSKLFDGQPVKFQVYQALKWIGKYYQQLLHGDARVIYSELKNAASTLNQCWIDNPSFALDEFWTGFRAFYQSFQIDTNLVTMITADRVFQLGAENFPEVTVIAQSEILHSFWQRCNLRTPDPLSVQTSKFLYHSSHMHWLWQEDYCVNAPLTGDLLVLGAYLQVFVTELKSFELILHNSRSQAAHALYNMRSTDFLTIYESCYQRVIHSYQQIGSQLEKINSNC